MSGQLRNLGSIHVLVLLAWAPCSQGEISGSLSLTSNYFWRGYTKSNNTPALQAFLDYQHSSGFYAGTWASQVDFDDDLSADRARVEVSPYFGWMFLFSPDWRADVELVRYLYDGDIFEASADYNEVYVRGHYRDLFSAQIAYANDAYSQGEATFDAHLGGRYPVTDVLQVSAGLGYSDNREVLEYNLLYWDAGLTWYLLWGGIDIRYVGAQETGSETLTDWAYNPHTIHNQLIVTLSAGF